MRDERAKAIPVFDPFLMGDNFQRFLKSLDGVVYAYEFLYGVMTLREGKESVMWLVIISNLILYWELAISCAPAGVIGFIYYNLYRKKKYFRPSADILKNMRFIQLSMGHFSDMVHLVYAFLEDYVFWGSPDKTMLLLKNLIKMPLPIMVTLYFMPLRLFMILALWFAALSHSPYWVSVFTIVQEKRLEGYYTFQKTYLSQIVSGIKNYIKSCFTL